MTLLIFTDLDGTLMEHESYSIDAARPALELLRARGVTPIINSSKTQAEIAHIQQQLQLQGPFIGENGAVLCNFTGNQEAGDVRQFGMPMTAWLDKVHDIRRKQNYRFEGFSDWSVTQVADRTGLSIDDAERAKTRYFSEPILWRDTAAALREFVAVLDSLELQLVEGGRFHCVQGRFDKSTAMNWLSEHSQDHECVVVALGDSPNDLRMLEAADIAVIIKSAKSGQMQVNHPTHHIRTQRPGPAGWHDAIVEILEMVDTGKFKKAEEIHHG